MIFVKGKSLHYQGKTAHRKNKLIINREYRVRTICVNKKKDMKQ